MALAKRLDRWKYVFVLFACLLLTSTHLTGCAIPITYHDAATYKNLTDLKAEAAWRMDERRSREAYYAGIKN